MSETQKRPTIRLNLSKPRHRQAWEYLQSCRDQSHTEVIVDALLCKANGELPAEALNAIRTAVREAVREALQANPCAPPPAASEPRHMTGSDFDAAMDFMNGL